MNILLSIFCLAVLLAIYAYAENQLLIIRRYICNIRPDTQRKLKIVQISDIHQKRAGLRIVEKTRNLAPDIILLTGDLVSRNETDLSQLDLLTIRLSEICPVFACPGNHELDLPPEIYKKYKNIMKKNGVCYLENKQTVFKFADTEFTLAGAALKKGIYKNPNGGYSDLEKLTAAELERDIGKKQGFTILLAHNPLCAKAYAQWGADIVFCGHVHGGAVRLPILGGLLSPERKFLPEYSKGIYNVENTTIVVSGGIGKIRLFNPPELVYCSF